MNSLAMARTLAVGAMLSFGVAHATSFGARWYEIDSDDGNLVSITYKSKTYSLASASPALYLDDQVWYYSGNLTPQTPQNIGGYVEQQYGLQAGSLTPVADCDSGSCSNGATMQTQFTRSGPVNTFTSENPFDYLAVDLCLGELLFHWTVATDTFTLAGLLTSGVSNYRAYIGPQVLATPLPGAALLFASALAGAGFMARRRSKQHGSASA